MKSKNNLDETNRYIISEMIKNGRVKYTKLAKDLGVTPAAVKERVDRLIKNEIIRPTSMVNIQKFFPITAGVGIEANPETVKIIVKKLSPCPLVLKMMKVSGNHNLVLAVTAKDFEQLESFLNNQIRSEPGINHIEVNVGNNTGTNKFAYMKLFHEKDTNCVPCGLRHDDALVCMNCPGLENVKNQKENMNEE